MPFFAHNQIRDLLSRPSLQPLWEKLLKLCHASMNYGGGQSVAHSGELAALKFAAKGFSSQRPIVIFDIGANDGDYIEVIRRVIARDDIQVYSFEPQRSSFLSLQANFGNDEKIHLRQLAVGKEKGTVELFFSDDGDSTASLHPAGCNANLRSEKVEMTTVDAICEESAIESIDFLKIDTEGHEVDVLLGARSMIEAGRVSVIQFEFGDTFLHTGYYFQDIFEMLAPRYTIYRILRSGLFEVSRYTHDLEIYKIANFLCIRKNPPNAK
jgi:FkbM family methyltransferase